MPIGTCPFPVCFEIAGSGLAVGSAEGFQFRRIERNGSSLLWRKDEPHFATAFLGDAGDDYVYAFGTIERQGVQQCYLARTKRIEVVETWEYFSGGWSGRVADAIAIFDGMPSELSVSYNEHLGAYLAVHSLGLTGKIVGRTAPKPWGPWSEATVLWEVKADPAPLAYPRLIYAGKEHPELARENGRVIYLTYVEFEEYWPRLVEVRLG